jgi:hypothetical protein
MALVALYVFTRKGVAGSVTSAVTGAVIDAAGGVVTGTVQGLGKQVGIPLTDAELCAKAMSERDSWNASLYCDLATYLKYEKDSIFGGSIVQAGTNTGATNAPVPQNMGVTGSTW